MAINNDVKLDVNSGYSNDVKLEQEVMTFFSEWIFLDATNNSMRKLFYPFKLLLFSLASKLHLPVLRFKMKKG